MPERVERTDRAERPARDERPRREYRDEAPARRATFAAGDMQRYRIEVGRNQGATPKEIVGAIANEGGIEGKYIGQIHLFDDYSTVELPALPPDVLAALKRTRVKQKPINIRPLAAGEVEEAPKRRWETKFGESKPGDPMSAPRGPSPWEKPWEKKREGRPFRSEAHAGKPAFAGERKFAGKPFKSAHTGKSRKP